MTSAPISTVLTLSVLFVGLSACSEVGPRPTDPSNPEPIGATVATPSDDSEVDDSPGDTLPGDDTPPTDPTTDEETEEETEEEEIVEVTSEAEPLEAPIFLPLDSYIVNLKDGRRYLKTTIQLMLSEEMANAYLTSRLVEIKDIVLTELQNLSVEEVKQAESREALRQRLISAISQVFPSKPEWEDPEPIKKVLFEEFVLQ